MPVTPEDAPHYREMRSSDERVYCATHIRAEKNQAPAIVHPAMTVMFGGQKLGDSDTLHPQITLYALAAPQGLLFIPTVDELEALGQSMLDFAARMRAEASNQAEALIKKARNGRA